MLLNKENYTIYKLKGILGYSKEEKSSINNELKNVLMELGMNYGIYVKNKNKIDYINNNIINIKKERRKILEELFIKRWERVYRKEGAYFENFTFEILEEALKIKNLKFIYENYNKLLENNGIFLTMEKYYKIFIEIILNINKNKKIKNNKFKRLKNKKLIGMVLNFFEKIEKKENLEINTDIKMYVYKILKNFEKIAKENDTFKKRKEINEIKEEEIHYSVEKYEENNGTQKELIHKGERIDTILILDVENKNKEKILKFYEYLFEKINVIEIYSYYEFKNQINIATNFEQILIISEINLRNEIINKCEKPIFFIKLEQDKGNKTRKIKALKNAIKIYEDMKNYKIFKKRDCYGGNSLYR